MIRNMVLAGVAALALRPLAPRRSSGTERDHGGRERHLRRCAPGSDGGGLEQRAHREDPFGDHRRRRRLSHRRPAPGHLQRQLCAPRLPDLQARGARSAGQFHGDDQRRDEGWRPRGIGHRVGRVTGGRCQHQFEVAGAEPRSAGRGPERQDHPEPRPVGRRREPELPRRGRQPRHAADLFRGARRRRVGHDGHGRRTRDQRHDG